MGILSVLNLAVCGFAALTFGTCWFRGRLQQRPGFGTPADEATFATLHTISLASPPLRAGLSRDSARRSARHLRALLGAEALALIAASADAPLARIRSMDGWCAGARPAAERPEGQRAACAEGPVALSPIPPAATVTGELLVWEGAGAEHAESALRYAEPVLGSGRPRVVVVSEPADCGDPLCRIRVGVIAPLTVEGRIAGAVAVFGPSAGAALVRALGQAARWVSTQLELAELDSSRARLSEAEMRALRAQISPHFVYNSLTTIASFVRTDPERARELLLDFADFARYSFRDPREYTTLAEELRSIDRYLILERARFGERLRFTVKVAPEVLSVALPFLSLQPLVENSIRHGMEAGRKHFHIMIRARDAGTEATISVEDDGVGIDPDRLRAILGGDRRGHGAGIGLANVDERMRQVYGDEYGLTVETAIGAGTKVIVRVPKCRPGVFPD